MNNQPETVFGSFLLGGDEFAIAANVIDGVVDGPSEVARQPLAPAYLPGLFTLRGMTIPLIDLRSLFGMEQATPITAMKVAVIDYEGRHVGLLFEQTGEVFRSSNPRCEYAPYGDDETERVTTGVFSFDKGVRVVQLLATRRIIELDRVPFVRATAEEPVAVAQLAQRRQKHQAVSVRVGDVQLAFSMKQVQEIVTIDAIENRSVTTGPCIGTAVLRDRLLPLVDLARVLHFEAQPINELEGKRFLVARILNQRFGLAVDEICDIVPYYEEDLYSFPVISVAKPELFLGAMSARDGSQVYLVDNHALLTPAELNEATRGHSEVFAEEQTTDKRSGVVERYLTFRIDKLYALSIAHVTEVLDHPDELLHPPTLGDAFDGVLNLRGELLGVINARKLYGMADASDTSRHIIVIHHAGASFGLAVSGIEAIEPVYESEKRTLPALLVNQGGAIANDVTAAIFRELQPGEPSGHDLLILDPGAIAARVAGLENAGLAAAS